MWMLTKGSMIFLLTAGCFSYATCQPRFLFPNRAYRTAENPHYWKHAPPRPGYWQQDVHYNIQVTLDTDSHRLKGELELWYWNNSPDTLVNAYFHLYQNAFVDGAHHLGHQHSLGQRPALSHWEALGKGTEVRNVRQGGQQVGVRVDNSILCAELATPMLPGDSALFQLTFTTYFGEGEQRRRMKMFDVPERQPDGTLKQVKHYDVAHWYPRMCVYDPVFKWHAAQHLGHEFYGNFGSYTVSITLPNQYVMDATGRLLNEDEIYPPGVRQKIALEQFAAKPIGEPALQALVPDGTTKTLHYEAVNVHDFAWTADPTYRWGEATWNGIRCIALAREENAGGWQDAASFTSDVIGLYSRDFGHYEYPKMIVADAEDGMEYPMLTLNGGHSPGYKDLLAHEVAHGWFFGMLGSNETYRAFMDEGFTQFLETWAMERLVANPGTSSPLLHRFPWGIFPYIRAAHDHQDGTLNTESDEMYHNYGMAYYKTAAMLYGLQYTLGDSLFGRAMRHYVAKWKFAHPYPADFREAVTEVANTNLTWFFDAWLETEKSVDYGIRRVRRSNGGQTVDVAFRRKRDLVMPLDLEVTTMAGDTLLFVLPPTYFAKADANREALPRWLQLRDLNRRHTTRLELPARFRSIRIDPSHRLPDVYLLDNQRGRGTSRLRLSCLQPDRKAHYWLRYNLNVRPALWWNGFGGLQVGAVANGDYIQDIHALRVGIWYSTGVGAAESPSPGLRRYAQDYQVVNYDVQYSTSLSRLDERLRVGAGSLIRDGAQRHQAWASKTWATANATHPAEFTRLTLGYVYLMRAKDAFRDYLNYPDRWDVNQSNATLQAKLESQYRTARSLGHSAVEARAAAPGSDAQYALARYTHILESRLFKKLKLRTRLFAQYADGALPAESALYLAEASPEQWLDSDFYRARGFFPDAWLATNQGREINHVQMLGGGLGLRGYAGYRPEFADATPAFVGASGASLNAELEFQGLSPLRLRALRRYAGLSLYAFYDAGILARNVPRAGFDGLQFGVPRQDAGLGAALAIRHPDLNRNPRQTVLRIDFPFFISNPPAVSPNHLAFRWVVGIGRAF